MIASPAGSLAVETPSRGGDIARMSSVHRLGKGIRRPSGNLPGARRDSRLAACADSLATSARCSARLRSEVLGHPRQSGCPQLADLDGESLPAFLGQVGRSMGRRLNIEEDTRLTITVGDAGGRETGGIPQAILQG
jgi:hypothetical protein